MAAILKSNMAAVQNLCCSIAPPSLYEKSMTLTQISMAGKDPKAAPKTRWADSIKHDFHSAGLNKPMLPRWSLTDPSGRSLFADCQRSNPEQVKSSTERDRNIFSVAAPTFFGLRKQIGRFINCFTVVILKFKMATILDLIWSISPQRVMIAK